MRLSFSHVKKEKLPVREFQKSCADLITESFVTVIGVFEQNQTTVAGKSTFSGEVERVSEVIEQVSICQLFFINTGSDDSDVLTENLRKRRFIQISMKAFCLHCWFYDVFLEL